MRRILRLCCALIATLAVVASAAGAEKARIIKMNTGPLNTGFIYSNETPWGSPELDAIQFKRMRAAGARFVRINLTWSTVAPPGGIIPAGFHPTDPEDPLYHWSGTDAVVQAAASAGLQPILTAISAPIWAQGTASDRPTVPGGYRPNATQFAQFLTAAATRYSGDTAGLPRVRYWAIWNEPNLRRYISPQMVGKKAVGSTIYRAMLNAGATALHNVASGNVVIAGETSPFGSPAVNRVKPLTFMERVLCISEKKVRKVWKYKSACKARVQFDVWSQHPYTEGGPITKARVHDDLPLGNMSDMREVLNTAIRAKHIVSSGAVRLWITEFSWDSKPPDPKGVPAAMEARWISEALYRSWSNGVSLFNWFLVRDQRFTRDSFYQSGLYTISKSDPTNVALDKAKPALRAFRFPFVALRDSKKKNTVSVWGRTPKSTAVSVQIQRKSGASWKLVKRLRANRYGIFQARFTKPAKTTMFRARLANGSDVSVPFSLNAPKKPWHGCAFGSYCHQNTPPK
jgi:hypothetical protein